MGLTLISINCNRLKKLKNSAEFFNQVKKIKVKYDIAQFWPGGFQAKVTIVIKRNIRFGWIMKLTFTSPVSSMEIFDAQVF